MNNNVINDLSGIDGTILPERIKNVAETINAYGAEIPAVYIDGSDDGSETGVSASDKSQSLSTSEKGDMLQQLSDSFQESFKQKHGYVMSGPQKRHMKKRLTMLINKGIIFIDKHGKLQILKGHKMNLFK